MFFSIDRALNKAQNGHLDLTGKKLKPQKISTLVDALNQRDDITSLALCDNIINCQTGELLFDLQHINKLDIPWNQLQELQIPKLRRLLEKNLKNNPNFICPEIKARDKVFAMLRDAEDGKIQKIT